MGLFMFGCEIGVCWSLVVIVVFFKQKTAYDMRISDWSSDVCSSDLFLDGIRSSSTGQDGPAPAARDRRGRPHFRRRAGRESASVEHGGRSSPQDIGGTGHGAPLRGQSRPCPVGIDRKSVV